MKRGLRSLLLLAGTICFGNFAKSQDRFAYTVTDSIQEGIKWNYIRKIDLTTGNFSNILLSLMNKNDTAANSSLYNGVAAAAVDRKNKKLYYTAMLTDRLNYVDLKTMKINTIIPGFSGLMPKAADQSNIITRMVIANEEYGYALTNDGNHLIRFGIKNNSAIDLGPLTDHPGNNGVSVHELCSSYGGDIVSDDEGSLYLITSRNRVFRINIQTKLAKFLGTVSGLPENFSTSGVAVDYRKDHVVIGSAVDEPGIYSVDIHTLAASALHAPGPWHIADLANSNSLKKESENEKQQEIFVSRENFYNDRISLYPNPVVSNEFTVRFSNMEPGTYTIVVMDVLGQIILTKALSTGIKNNTIVLNLPGSVSKGILAVRITDKMNKAVYSEKVILQ